jgi:hypothetical protein
MDKYQLATKIVTGVALAIVINWITPHVEEALDNAIMRERVKRVKKAVQ